MLLDLLKLFRLRILDSENPKMQISSVPKGWRGGEVLGSEAGRDAVESEAEELEAIEGLKAASSKLIRSWTSQFRLACLVRRAQWARNLPYGTRPGKKGKNCARM